MYRIRLIITLIALFALAGVTTAAQSTTTTFCGDLSEADCAIIQNTEIAPSAAFNGAGTLDVTMDGTPFAAQFDMRGTYTPDAERIAKLEQLNAMTPAEQVAKITNDPQALLTLITDAFQIVNSEMTLDVSLPPELVGEMIPVDYTLDLWLVDGVAYADLAGLSALDPTLEGVYGVDMVALYTSIFNDSETAELLEASLTGTDSIITTSLMDPDFGAEFTILARLDDTTVNGVEVAVFETTIDYGALFDSDTIREALRIQLESQFESMREMGLSGDEVAEIDIDALVDAYVVIFDGATLVTTTAIGLEDNYTHSTSVALDMQVDLATIMMLASPANEDIRGDDLPMFIIDLNFTVTQDSFGTVDEVTLPADAQTLPMEMFGL